MRVALYCVAAVSAVANDCLFDLMATDVYLASCSMHRIIHKIKERSPLCIRQSMCKQCWTCRIAFCTCVAGQFVVYGVGKSWRVTTFALQLWLVDYFYLIAGILFLLAGAFYCMHESSIYLVPGESSMSDTPSGSAPVIQASTWHKFTICSHTRIPPCAIRIHDASRAEGQG